MIAIILSVSFGNVAQPPLDNGQPTVAEVRALAAGDLFDCIKLCEYGVVVFPAYEVILKDPKSSAREIRGVLSSLGAVKAPKSHFLPLALPHVCHKDFDVRTSVLGLIEKDGTENEASILIALLSDKDRDFAIGAASVLTKIGGPRELVAIDVWLRTGTAYRDDRAYLDYIKECRDKLDKRLKESPLPKGSKN